MNILKDERKEVVLLRCEGRLDAITSPHLEEEINHLIGLEKNKILVDFSRVDYLSSAGMRLLLSATKRLRNKQGGFGLFSIHEEVKEIIYMAGFERVLSIYSSEDEALKAQNEKNG